MLGNSDPLEDVVLEVLIVLLKMILFFKEFFFFFFFRKYGTNNSEKIKWVCTRIAPESIFFLFKSKNMSKEDNSGRKTLISLLNSPVDSI